MLKLLIEKELKAFLQSPKFVLSFSVMSILIILSVYLGVEEYHATKNQYETARQLAAEDLQSQTNWGSVYTRAFREPNPLMIFASGVQNDIGRKTIVSKWQENRLQGSLYSEDSVFAIFRVVDFVFIFQTVVSLFAILFTFNAINGEKESGTLQLTFSNSIPRALFISAKALGAIFALCFPLLIPVLLSFLIVVLFGVPMEPEHWLKACAIIALGLSHFIVFILLGILVSSSVRNSATSFLVLISLWITFVLILPRAGMMIASEVIPIPSISELDTKMEAFSKSKWDEKMKREMELYEKYNKTLETLTPKERDAKSAEMNWDIKEESEALQKKLDAEIAEFNRKTNEEAANQQAAQEDLALWISRISPSSAFQLASMSLAETDVETKYRYESAIRSYRDRFITYINQKQKESGSNNGFTIHFDKNGIKVHGASSMRLNFENMPVFQPPIQSGLSITEKILPDIGLLIFYALSFFALAFVLFLRFDIR
ncbi:MAG: ABC transporter permease subunit [Chloroherpetonaceae bacterium]|nr:ABC transporter permease subunit [Chloroherpetonaceae bacterium]